jgi:nucleoside-diphosphate-sugar epimerase
MTFEPDPDVVISRTVNGTLNALEASLEHGTIKRFVLTSSSGAVAAIPPNKKGIVIDEGKETEFQ